MWLPCLLLVTQVLILVNVVVVKDLLHVHTFRGSYFICCRAEIVERLDRNHKDMVPEACSATRAIKELCCT